MQIKAGTLRRAKETILFLTYRVVPVPTDAKVDESKRIIENIHGWHWSYALKIINLLRMRNPLNALSTEDYSVYESFLNEVKPKTFKMAMELFPEWLNYTDRQKLLHIIQGE